MFAESKPGVLFSIRPYWLAQILNERKKIELRTRPPRLNPPFKCYLYCTNGAPYLVDGDVFRGNWETEYTTTFGYSREEADRIWGVMNGKVVAECVCDRIDRYSLVGTMNSPKVYMKMKKDGTFAQIPGSELSETGMTWEDFVEFADGRVIYGLHFTNLKTYGVYDEFKKLDDFRKPCPNAGKCSSCDYHYSGDWQFEPPCCVWDEVAESALSRPPQSWYYVEER